MIFATNNSPLECALHLDDASRHATIDYATKVITDALDGRIATHMKHRGADIGIPGYEDPWTLWCMAEEVHLHWVYSYATNMCREYHYTHGYAHPQQYVLETLAPLVLINQQPFNAHEFFFPNTTPVIVKHQMKDSDLVPADMKTWLPYQRHLNELWSALTDLGTPPIWNSGQRGLPCFHNYIPPTDRTTKKDHRP